MTDPYTPLPEHGFTFGLWTAVGHGKRFPIDPNGQRIGQYDQAFHSGHEHLDELATERLLGAR
jgi:hypothetical protein